MIILKILLLLALYIDPLLAIPDQGKWDFQLSQASNVVDVPKSLFKGSKIFIHVTCTENLDNDISIQWSLSETPCWNDLFLNSGIIGQLQRTSLMSEMNNFTIRSPVQQEKCVRDRLILVNEVKIAEPSQVVSKMPTEPREKGVLDKPHTSSSSRPVFTITKDGIYVLVLKITSTAPSFLVNVHIEMKGTYGYLSAVDWPLLPFYGAMCLVYVILGIVWLVVSFLQWRELIRIQFWIGGVILLGMLEKATFYAEYQSINSTGESALPGAVFFAELVSCAKRTVARMLVIVVSLGFGIVKPRLGAMLHRVVVVGVLYFGLATLEAYLRIYDERNNIMLSSIPLALLDSTICWWIFTSLVHTTRTLRLRHNLVKLSLYTHFMHTLTFAVLSSVVFMLYSISQHRVAECVTRWKELWIDDAYWHLLFSLILIVIMILWRPMNNSQRYAFTPLLDPSLDDEDDEEVEQFINESMGMKLRPPPDGGDLPAPSKPTSTLNFEQDMDRAAQTVVPSLLDSTVLPLLDSDEELMNTRFEVSKMQ
uniref:Transmembrane protein 87A n=1 Tax=Cacopsylla melanoneura TaxID=428564 RepID=A0A8D8LB16_9HEMI